LSQGDPPSELWRVSKATRIIRVITGRWDETLTGFDASVNGKVVMSNCQASAVPLKREVEDGLRRFAEIQDLLRQIGQVNRQLLEERKRP
jgi:hypothetical protein